MAFFFPFFLCSFAEVAEVMFRLDGAGGRWGPAELFSGLLLRLQVELLRGRVCTQKCIGKGNRVTAGLKYVVWIRIREKVHLIKTFSLMRAMHDPMCPSHLSIMLLPQISPSTQLDSPRVRLLYRTGAAPGLPLLCCPQPQKASFTRLSPVPAHNPTYSR